MAKLWDKGIQFDKKIESFTVGNDNQLDNILIPYDCKASIAHAKMLSKMGYINKKELVKISKILNEIIGLHKKGKFLIKVSQEDCHTAIEEYLVNKIGDAGKKIHTARSRNDQALTALRLYYKEELLIVKSLMEKWIDSMTNFGQKNKNVKFPGYTHMQKAMPSSIQMWSEGHRDSMMDDLKIHELISKLIDQSPMGSAAGYGLPISIDKNMISEDLGFFKVQENPIHCQLSRGKYEIALINMLSQILLTINRVAADMIQFSMEELSYFSLPKELCSGSSIMPQKNNPDVLEVLRASYHIISGLESQVKTLTSNLMSGYNRDVQLSKEPVIKSFKIAKECLNICSIVIDKIVVNADRCKEALTDDLFSTEKVYELVKKGIPFREAYQLIALKNK